MTEAGSASNNPYFLKAEQTTFTALRIVVGIIMSVHGWQKATNFAQWQTSMSNLDLPLHQMFSYLAVAGELLGGIGMIVGLFTPIAAFGIACVMAVAIFG